MNLIVAVDQNWAIGNQNRLLVRISADLKRFKALTMGHPVILGRKTLETFPGGRPLPGRENYILSTTPAFEVENARVLHTMEEALAACPADAFVIGGESVYRALLGVCDTAYVTKIHAAYPADAWFPNLDTLPDWVCSTEEPAIVENGVTFHYAAYQRKK